MLSIKTNVQKSLENQNYSFIKSASCKNRYRQNMNDYVILQKLYFYYANFSNKGE